MLYDYLGRPIQTSSLRRTQAEASLTGVRNYYEMVPSRAVSPAKLATILRAAAQGDIIEQAKLFEDMEEKDSHIFAEMAKRKGAVAGRPWSILPGEDTPQAGMIAEFVQEVFNGLDVEEMMLDALDAVGKGFSAQELTWEMSGGKWIVTGAMYCPQTWFQYVQGQTELRLINGNTDGEALTPAKWLIHRHKARSGSPYRGALYRVLAWLFLFRNYGIKAWTQFTESYGMPIRIGKYPLGTPEAEQDTLLAALSAIATDAAAIIPDGMMIEIIEQAKTGNASHHERLLDWTGKSISIAILGQTLTTDAGDRGTQALGTVHDGVRRDILASDAKRLVASLNRQMIRPLVDLNFGPQEVYPYFQVELPDTEDKTALATNLKTLTDAGFKDIPVWWIRERFGIPEPGKDDVTLATLKAPSAPDTPNTQSATKFSNRLQMNAAQTAQDGGQKNIDDLAGSMNPADLQSQAEALLAPIIELIREGTSYNDILEQLATAYTGMDSSALLLMLERAVFVSELQGRTEGLGA